MQQKSTGPIFESNNTDFIITDQEHIRQVKLLSQKNDKRPDDLYNQKNLGKEEQETEAEGENNQG
jgi:hypothetical protein